MKRNLHNHPDYIAKRSELKEMENRAETEYRLARLEAIQKAESEERLARLEIMRNELRQSQAKIDALARKEEEAFTRLKKMTDKRLGKYRYEKWLEEEWV
jgi:small-conductance mechanosensitive channel